jgi:Zn-dependent protease
MGALTAMLDLGLQLLPLVMAIVLHELAHGYVARACGDATAAEQGRLSWNPVRHLDPIGSLLVPGVLLVGAYAAGVRPVLFGWARPVPIDARRLRAPRRDMILVALAGPGCNLVLAALAAAALGGLAGALPASRFESGPANLAGGLLVGTVVVNCVLGIFNLLPVPPLDGGRVLQAALPRSMARHLRALDGVGMAVVVVLVVQTNVVGALARPVIAWLLSWAG